VNHSVYSQLSSVGLFPDFLEVDADEGKLKILSGSGRSLELEALRGVS